MDNSPHSIILFDGVCNFCNSSVNLIIKNDKKGYFKFAALQSETGVGLQKKFNLDPTELSSFILIENDKMYKKTSAALRVAKHMDKLYPLLYAFIILPPFMRDWAYNIIAKNRYKWFGKKDSCMIPTQDVRSRFLN